MIDSISLCEHVRAVFLMLTVPQGLVAFLEVGRHKHGLHSYGPSIVKKPMT